MKSKLYVRGLKEPIDLEMDEALAAQSLISDSSKASDTPFSIENVWTGKKADMRFVVFPGREDEHSQRTIIAMTEDEARMFESEIAQYKQEAVREGFKENNWLRFWFKGKGVVRLVLTTLSPGKRDIQMFVRDTNMYHDL